MIGAPSIASSGATRHVRRRLENAHAARGAPRGSQRRCDKLVCNRSLGPARSCGTLRGTFHAPRPGMTLGKSTMVFLVGAIGAVLVLPARARACSPPHQGILAREPWPSDGATSVPTNARIVVRYIGDMTLVSSPDAVLGGDLELAPADGPALRTHREVFEIDPMETVVVLRADLAPSTSYVVRDRRAQIPCGEPASACRLTEPTVFATFTTGAGPDTAPPAFAGLSRISRPEKRECLSPGGCCQLTRSLNYHLEWQPATDEVATGSLRYNVYDARDLTKPIRRYVEGTTHHDGKLCSIEGATLPEPVDDYVVRAVDWAGNEDKNTEALSSNASCAAVYALPDPGPVRPGQPDSGGCSYAPAGAPTFVACAALGAWLSVWRRRRRAR